MLLRCVFGETLISQKKEHRQASHVGICRSGRSCRKMETEQAIQCLFRIRWILQTYAMKAVLRNGAVALSIPFPYHRLDSVNKQFFGLPAFQKIQ